MVAEGEGVGDAEPRGVVEGSRPRVEVEGVHRKVPVEGVGGERPEEGRQERVPGEVKGGRGGLRGGAGEGGGGDFLVSLAFALALLFLLVGFAFSILLHHSGERRHLDDDAAELDERHREPRADDVDGSPKRRRRR